MGIGSRPRSHPSSTSTAGLVPATQAHGEHANLALDLCTARFELTSSPEQMLDDWYSAGYGTFYATQILEALANLRGKESPATDVELSKAMADELQATGSEECKAVLAWLRWKNCGAIVDSNVARMQEDWSWACGALAGALSGPPPAERQASVRDWVTQRYVAQRGRTILEKAYCHSVGTHASGHERDHDGAAEYVDGLAARATKAVAIGATTVDHEALVGFLLDPANLEWEDSLEALLPRIVAIERL